MRGSDGVSEPLTWPRWDPEARMSALVPVWVSKVGFSLVAISDAVGIGSAAPWPRRPCSAGCVLPPFHVYQAQGCASEVW